MAGVLLHQYTLAHLLWLLGLGQGHYLSAGHAKYEVLVTRTQILLASAPKMAVDAIRCLQAMPGEEP